MDLRLTDDEVVALATMQEKAPPSPLPTVDTENLEAVLSAGFRGLRSLEVRDLVSDAGVLDDRLATAATIVGRTSLTCVFVASSTLERASWDFASTHYRDGDRWIIEGVDAIGIHHIGSVSVAERREAVQELLRSAVVGSLKVRTQVDGEDRPQLVMLDVRDSRPVSAVIANDKGVFYAVVEGADGMISLCGDAVEVSVSAALSHLD